jgi:hypothetical protein
LNFQEYDMLYTVRNDSPNPRTVFAAGRQPAEVPMGGEAAVEMEPHEAANAVADGVTVTGPDGRAVAGIVDEKREPGWRPFSEGAEPGEAVKVPRTGPTRARS